MRHKKKEGKLELSLEKGDVEGKSMQNVKNNV